MTGLAQISGVGQVIAMIFGEIYGSLKKRVQELLKPGLYEVLDYQTTLEIHDPKGKLASLSKIQKVKFLQDNIISYQDQAWGDGSILIHYQCSPGVAVDKYRSGHNTNILISLRETRNRGDIDEIRINWKMKNVFLKRTGFWETSINHQTNYVSIIVIFPYCRPPKDYSIFESNSQKNFDLDKESLIQLPDKRWQLTWRKDNPRIHEHYILKWIW